MLLDQVGEAHHGRQREGAVADEVGRHVQLHPPALERRHQRLDLPGVARERVPQQEHHRRGHHQQHEATQRAGGVLAFVVQVEQGRDQREQHEHFIQVADRDVPQVRAHQVAFAPAHQHAGGAGEHRAPGQRRAQPGGRGAEEADPVADHGQREQRAHPQDGGLRREQVLQEEHLLGARQVVAVEHQRHAGRDGTGHHQAARTPQPAQPGQRRHGAAKDDLLVVVHGAAMAHERIARAGRQQQEEHEVGPVGPAALGAAVAGFGQPVLPQRFRRGGMRGGGRRGHGTLRTYSGAAAPL